MSETSPPAGDKLKKKLNTIQAHRVRLQFDALLADHARQPLTAEEIHLRCGSITKVTSQKLSPCGKCTRQLTARQRLRACPFCGWGGNWKLAKDEAEKRLTKELNKELEEAKKYERERRDKGYVFE